jgi:hypothetical protein
MRRREFIAIFGGVVVGRRARLLQSGSSKLASTGSAYWWWCCRAGTLPTPQHKLFFNLLDRELVGSRLSTLALYPARDSRPDLGGT